MHAREQEPEPARGRAAVGRQVRRAAEEVVGHGEPHLLDGAGEAGAVPRPTPVVPRVTAPAAEPGLPVSPPASEPAAAVACAYRVAK